MSCNAASLVVSEFLESSHEQRECYEKGATTLLSHCKAPIALIAAWERRREAEVEEVKPMATEEKMATAKMVKMVKMTSRCSLSSSLAGSLPNTYFRKKPKRRKRSWRTSRCP